MHQSAGVAQSVEQLTCNEKVEGSIPFSGTNYPSLAQSGSASGLGPEGREFESLNSDQVLQVSASEVTLSRFLRRTKTVKGKWVQLPPAGNRRGL
jgi:hypothetical protein